MTQMDEAAIAAVARTKINEATNAVIAEQAVQLKLKDDVIESLKRVIQEGEDREQQQLETLQTMSDRIEELEMQLDERDKDKVDGSEPQEPTLEAV